MVSGWLALVTLLLPLLIKESPRGAKPR